jgi:hypothetical protein
MGRRTERWSEVEVTINESEDCSLGFWFVNSQEDPSESRWLRRAPMFCKLEERSGGEN